MSIYTGQPEDKIAEDTDRDFYMMPEVQSERSNFFHEIVLFELDRAGSQGVWAYR